ncbi:MAG: FMN-binding protein [Chitinivibrionales bacterium]
MKKYVIIAAVGLIVMIAAAGMFSFRQQRMAGNIENHYRQLSNWDLQTIPDGIYSGSFKEFLVSVNLAVTVENNRITDIEIVAQQSGPGYEARETIERIKDAQQPKVDAVTGATVSSMAIMIAADRAIRGAVK